MNVSNKPLTVILIVILALIGGGTAFVLTRQNSISDNDAAGMNSQLENDTDDTNTQSPSAINSGRYVDYENGLIENTEGTKLLFFHAPWCPQCRQLEADILEKGVPDGVSIIKVDFDSNQKLRQKYGVTLQTTLVKVDDNGNEISKFVAYDDPSLAAVETNLL